MCISVHSISVSLCDISVEESDVYTYNIDNVYNVVYHRILQGMKNYTDING